MQPHARITPSTPTPLGRLALRTLEDRLRGWHPLEECVFPPPLLRTYRTIELPTFRPILDGDRNDTERGVGGDVVGIGLDHDASNRESRFVCSLSASSDSVVDVDVIVVVVVVVVER
jgi:hypothetical protein